jgi:hypothetical protein
MLSVNKCLCLHTPNQLILKVTIVFTHSEIKHWEFLRRTQTFSTSFGVWVKEKPLSTGGCGGGGKQTN